MFSRKTSLVLVSHDERLADSLMGALRDVRHDFRRIAPENFRTCLPHGRAPEIVFLDLSDEQVSVAEIMSFLRACELPSPACVVAVAQTVDDRLGRALRMGAADFLLMTDAPEIVAARLKVIIRKQDEFSELHQQVTILGRLASYDDVTGVLNRRSVNLMIEAETSDARRLGLGLALFLVDMDNFKVVNDTLGHLHGDDVLRKFSALMGHCLRSGNVVGRFGGDEFCFVDANTDLAAARCLGERLVGCLHDDALLIDTPDRGRVRLTASIGAAYAAPGSFPTAATMLALADRALYEAKNGGRDRFVLHELDARVAMQA